LKIISSFLSDNSSSSVDVPLLLPYVFSTAAVGFYRKPVSVELSSEWDGCVAPQPFDFYLRVLSFNIPKCDSTYKWRIIYQNIPYKRQINRISFTFCKQLQIRFRAFLVLDSSYLWIFIYLYLC